MEISSQPNTIGSSGRRNWIYAAEVKGRFQRRRYLIATLLLIVFYLTPWIKIGGDPLLRFGFVSNDFYFMGYKLFPYELYHFLLLGLILALTLFLSTTLFGRVWCGYSCPQTVFIEILFGKIERLIEGRAAQRKLLSKQQLSVSKILKKVVKFSIFTIISISFGVTFVSYFAEPTEVIGLQSRHLNIFVFLLSAAALFDGAYWKEQFCHIVCPYARFQSVMLSPESITIGYDEARGEPRKKGKDRTDAGDCVDCKLCVQVCPSGIDIRQGIGQQECTGCARCVDACDTMMSSLKRPTGLIRYDSEFNFSAQSKDRVKTKLSRPLPLTLASLWVVICVVGVYQLWTRPAYHARLLSAPGQSGVKEGNRVKMLYTLRLSNQSKATQEFSIDATQGVSIENGQHMGPLEPGVERLYPLLISFDDATPLQKVDFVVHEAHSDQTEHFERPLLKLQ